MRTIETTLVEVSSYRQLLAGWHDEHSPAPREKEIVAVESFLRALPPDLAPPIPMISGVTAQLGLYWDRPENYIDLEFEEEGVISVLIVHRRSTPREHWFPRMTAGDFTPEFLTTHFCHLRKVEA
ncbi:hypothetical protein [Paraburkholderia sp. BCC1886]|uniref:hypothetical protein n=1 Tax=Paraburkholderia sp. BCC1886 TaxID=2562670 RepID=UPI001182B747|nr:hypothetical protein [Paraburkholderia sp. BCC1886]